MTYTIEGTTGAWEVVIGLEVHAQVISKAKLFSGAATAFGARAEHAGELRRCRLPRHAAGDQPRMRGAGGAHRARAERAHQPGQPLRPQELLLRRSARRLSDQPVRSIRSSAPARSRSNWPTAARKQIGITRLHLEQDAGKSLHDQHPTKSLHRPQPRRRRADGDRERTRYAHPRGSRRLSAQAAHHPALSRHLRRQHGGRLHARRRERVGAQARRAVSARAAR